MTRRISFSVGAVTRFYVPLLLQAFSQSLTYPLVAGIVTHGRFGVNALTAFTQGQMIMFMIGALGGGLVMTGMVFARTWYGYVSFRRLNALMMAALLAIQCVPAVYPLNRWLFEGFFALPPELASISRWTLLLGVVMNGAFFLRNVPLVVLFNSCESGKASNATFVRIGVTVLCAALFPRWGWVGAYWRLLALTLGVLVELLVTWAYARPYVRELRGEAKVDVAMSGRELCSLTFEQFRFTLPLSLGGFLLMLSPLCIAAFVGRTENAADMLAIHYVTLGVANPVSYAALRMQAVSIQFQPEYPGDRRLLAYAVVAGLLLGVVPLALATPLDDLPDWSSLKEMRDALEKFAVEKLAKYTVRQVTCCVMWCMFGSDWAVDERAASRDDDECDDGHDDELTSPSVGVIRDGMALGLGISLHDAMHMTRSGLHAVVMRAYKLKGVDVSKSVYDRAIGDYYATLDEIKRSHAKEMEKHGK